MPGCRSRSRPAHPTHASPRSARLRNPGIRWSADNARPRPRVRREARSPRCPHATQCAAIRIGAEQPLGGEQPDPGLAGRRDEERRRGASSHRLRRRASRARQRSRRGGSPGQAELCAGAVHLDRARIRSMRRDADGDPIREQRRDRARAISWNVLERGRVTTEDLQVDDRAQARRGRRGRGGSREAAVADRRDARAQALVCADGRDRDHVVESRAPACAERACPIQGTNGSPSPNPA